MPGGELVALRALRNGALNSPRLPARLKLLAWGENQSCKGPILVDEQSAASIAHMQARLGFDRVALDFEHNTVPDTPEYRRSQEPRPVAAYGVPHVIPGDGLYLEDLQWTPAGREQARNYADLSPAVALDAAGRVKFLHSVALVRNGAVFDLSFFSTNHNSNQNTDPNPMPENKTIPANPADFVTLAILAGAFGLPATATAADVQGKLTALNASGDLIAAMEGRIKKLEDSPRLKSGPESNAKADPAAQAITALAAHIEILEQAMAHSAAAAEQSERDRLVLDASKDGQVIPLSADELKTIPLATLKALVQGLPKGMVALSTRTADTGGESQHLNGLARAAAAFRIQAEQLGK